MKVMICRFDSVALCCRDKYLLCLEKIIRKTNTIYLKTSKANVTDCVPLTLKERQCRISDVHWLVKSLFVFSFPKSNRDSFSL